MLKTLIAITVSITIGWAALGATAPAEPSLKDQILALDKELGVLRKDTLADPKVKVAQAELQVALIKLKATEDDVLLRTNPKGKELVEKFRKLLEQYKAQQTTAGAKASPTP